MKPGNNILSHHSSHLVVIGTDESCMFPRTCLTFKHNNWYALVISPVYGRRNGLHLIRCNNQQVDTRSYKAVYLLHLSLIAIVCCRELQFYIVVKVCSHLQLRILFVAPDVIRTL